MRMDEVNVGCFTLPRHATSVVVPTEDPIRYGMMRFCGATLRGRGPPCRWLALSLHPSGVTSEAH